MIASRIVRLVLLASAFGLATWLAGWLAVPVVSATWGVMGWRQRGATSAAAVAAALAWGGLLALIVTRGDLVTFASRLGGAVGLPGPGVILVTLLFAAALAWSAAVLAAGAARALADSRRGPSESRSSGT